MVEKKVRDINPEYYTGQAVEKKQSNLFSKVRTRESADLHEEEDTRQTVIKKQKRSLNIDVTGKEY